MMDDMLDSGRPGASLKIETLAKIKKRDGRIVEFKAQKIVNAIAKAGFGEGGLGMQGSQMGKGKGFGKSKGFGLQSGMNQGGQAGQGGMGGMLIAGVRTLNEDEPFRVHNGLTEYSEWLFSYLDLEQQGQQRRGRQQGRGIEGPGSANTGATGNYPGFGSGASWSPGQQGQ